MITETYEGAEIVLLEDENKWRFTVNGRERTAPTLPKAREYIDNALDAVDRKVKPKFEPISVYYLSAYCGDGDIRALTKGRITSITDETDYNRSPKVWVTTEGRGREKRSITELCVDSPRNVALFEQLKAIQATIDAAKQELRRVGSGIERVNITANAD